MHEDKWSVFHIMPGLFFHSVLQNSLAPFATLTPSLPPNYFFFLREREQFEFDQYKICDFSNCDSLQLL